MVWKGPSGKPSGQASAASSVGSPYSHGLEKIYAFETIDPGTIRIASVKPQEAHAPNPASPTIDAMLDEPTFDFGRGFHTRFSPLRLREPIERLGLSAYAHKALMHERLETIMDVVTLFRTPPRTGRTLGQGIIDEIEGKLASYIGHDPVARRKRMDFSTFVRLLAQKRGAKERHLVLSAFGLEALTRLTPGEQAELHNMSRSDKERIVGTAMQAIRHEAHDLLCEGMQEVAQVFLRPWLRTRLGMASASELQEALGAIAEEPHLVKQTLAFLDEVSAPRPLFTHSLDLADSMVVAVSEEVAAAYRDVVEAARRYFYHPAASFPIEQLTVWVAREYARSWQGFADGFIEKALRISPAFTLFREAHGALLIRRSMDEILLTTEN